MRKRRPKGILDRMRLWKAVFLLGVSFLFYLLVLSPHGGAVKEYSARNSGTQGKSRAEGIPAREKRSAKGAIQHYNTWTPHRPISEQPAHREIAQKYRIHQLFLRKIWHSDMGGVYYKISLCL